MTERAPRKSVLLMLVLAYSLLVMCWGAWQYPLSPDEAKMIYTGREAVTGKINGLSGPVNAMMDDHARSFSIAPMVIAGADRVAGFYASRGISVIIGLALVVLIFLIGSTSPYGNRGILAATTFVFLGISLHLTAFATTTPYTALFFGVSFLLVEISAEARTTGKRILMLLAGGLSLAAAVTTSYISILFVAPFVLYSFLRHRFFHVSVFFVLPLIASLFFYRLTAVLPVWTSLERSLLFPLSHSYADVLTSLNINYIFNWLAMPYLLAFFGIFHHHGGKKAFFMMLLSSSVFLVMLITPDLNTAHLAVLLATILLAPAASLGVDHMGNLFSSHNPMAQVKPLFTAAVLVVVWVFGLQQIKELNRYNPDLSSAVNFLRSHDIGDRTVLIESDYGSPEYVYRYFLESGNRPARVLSLVRATEQERIQYVDEIQPDYVVLDDYHSDRSFNLASLDYISRGFRLAKTYQMSLSSGSKTIKIFQKGAL
jgi:hypothetical protein